MDKICFSCVGCGKCCNSPPRLALSEIPQFVDTFAMQLEIYVQLGELSRPSYKQYAAQKEQFHKLGGVSFSNSRFEGIARIVGEPLAFRNDSRCPKLVDDSSCSIYQDRPSICRVVPLDITMPSRAQDMALTSFKAKVQKENWPCIVDDRAPVVWENGELAEGQYKSAYIEAVTINSEDALQKRFLSFLRYGEREFIQIAHEQQQGLKAHFPLIAFVECFPELFPDPIGLAETQLTFLRAGIADNIARKSKADKSATEALRQAEKIWTTFLQRRACSGV